MAAARTLLKDVRSVVDQILTTGGVPSVLPSGVAVSFASPPLAPIVGNTLRALVERHFILGFAALAVSYDHEVVGDTAASSSVDFGPAFLAGLDAKVTEQP